MWDILKASAASILPVSISVSNCELNTEMIHLMLRSKPPGCWLFRSLSRLQITGWQQTPQTVLPVWRQTETVRSSSACRHRNGSALQTENTFEAPAGRTCRCAEHDNNIAAAAAGDAAAAVPESHFMCWRVLKSVSLCWDGQTETWMFLSWNQELNMCVGVCGLEKAVGDVSMVSITTTGPFWSGRSQPCWLHVTKRSKPT